MQPYLPAYAAGHMKANWSSGRELFRASTFLFVAKETNTPSYECLWLSPLRMRWHSRRAKGAKPGLPGGGRPGGICSPYQGGLYQGLVSAWLPLRLAQYRGTAGLDRSLLLGIHRYYSDRRGSLIRLEQTISGSPICRPGGIDLKNRHGGLGDVSR